MFCSHIFAPCACLVSRRSEENIRALGAQVRDMVSLHKGTEIQTRVPCKNKCC